MRNLALPASPGETRTQLVSGDVVRVRLQDGRRHSVRVEETRASSFVGTTVRLDDSDTEPAGRPIEVPYADITQLEVKRFSALKTAVLVAGGLLVVVAAATAACKICGPH